MSPSTKIDCSALLSIVLWHVSFSPQDSSLHLATRWVFVRKRGPLSRVNYALTLTRAVQKWVWCVSTMVLLYYLYVRVCVCVCLCAREQCSADALHFKKRDKVSDRILALSRCQFPQTTPGPFPPHVCSTTRSVACRGPSIFYTAGRLSASHRGRAAPHRGRSTKTIDRSIPDLRCRLSMWSKLAIGTRWVALLLHHGGASPTSCKASAGDQICSWKCRTHSVFGAQRTAFLNILALTVIMSLENFAHLDVK